MATDAGNRGEVVRSRCPLGDKAQLPAFHDMLVVVLDCIAKLVKNGKAQEQAVGARPMKEFEEKYGGANFNADQWIGRAYVDQKAALEKRAKNDSRRYSKPRDKPANPGFLTT